MIDSPDIPLNVSRSYLQSDANVKKISNYITRKVADRLQELFNTMRPDYESKWDDLKIFIQYGILTDEKFAEKAQDFMLWKNFEGKYFTSKEYLEKVKENQTDKNKTVVLLYVDDPVEKHTFLEAARGKGYDVLLLTEDVDEFCLQILRTYPRKDAEGKDGTVEFKNVNSGDLGLETEEEKKAAEDATAENKPLFDAMKDALNGKVKEVKVNPTLQEHPVTLPAEGGLSMEMEKVLRRMPIAEGVESTKVLELTPNHTVFAALKAAHAAGDTDKVAKYAELLYDQALLIAGLPIEDPVAYAQLVCGRRQ